MVTLMSLWLPILLSAVAVFLASFVIHMVLTYHRSDVRPLPNEQRVQEAVRGTPPGLTYFFPHAPTPKEMSSPAMIEKFKAGPVGMLTVFPPGPPTMTKNLVQWFVFTVAVGVFVAYVCGRALAPGAEYLAVFRIAGTVAFLGHAGAEATNAIWRGQSWGTTVKNYADGLVYALLTAGVFGWLWPAG
jgi:hypothetical protein